MTGDARLVYDEGLTSYNFGPRHPLAPVRVELTVALASELGVLGPGALDVVPAPMASDDLVATVHHPAYIEAVRQASAHPERSDLAAGLGTSDNPTFAGMHEASAHVVGASVEAARLVWEREVQHAVNIAGGLHHAMPGWASGFCVYNDPATAIRWLLDAGCPRVAYVDVDVHHGDGVQAIFWDDPRVLTISLHESPQSLFPFVSGFPSEIGGPDAEGTAVNVALPPGTGDLGWLRAFHAVVPPLVHTFDPTVLVSQHGCDSHVDDPLAHLALSVDGQRAAAVAVHQLAHDVCAGRWVATGGGGYAIVDVVPRTWTHLLAVVGGRPLDPETETPDAWRKIVTESFQRRPPRVMTDHRTTAYVDWSSGYDPGNALDQAVLATRTAVFPHHGLDPLF